jgi:membrane protein YqaA with SNARE-associated domain
MGHIVARVRDAALALGGPGLALVAFLDSTFLPLPGITDLLLIVMVTRRRSAMPWLVLLTVAGSVAGCLVMHAIGRKGGDALIRKRFTGDRIARATASLQRHGVMAVLVPSLLPPPAPFKIFLLLAGAAGISAAKFAVAIAIGRAARYFTLGILAVRFGTSANEYVREHGTAASLIVVCVLALSFVVYLVASKARAGTRR